MTEEQLEALAEKAKLVWGPINMWDKAQVNEIGEVIRTYTASRLAFTSMGITHLFSIENAGITHARLSSPQPGAILNCTIVLSFDELTTINLS